MQDTFSGGYFKCLLDVKNYIDRHSNGDRPDLKSQKMRTKKFQFVMSLIEFLLDDSYARTMFMEQSGKVVFWVDEDTGKIDRMRDPIEERSADGIRRQNI